MISVQKIDFAYNGWPVLREVSFSVARGEFLAVIGPNGAGKSTLLKLLDGILQPQKGYILLKERPLPDYSRRQLARLIGYVPQEFPVAFHFTAREVVLMGRFPYQRLLGGTTAEDYRVAQEAMQITDCGHLSERFFTRLSGGEKQRVVLASALAQQPEMLLLDEPTTALDLKHQVHFYRILQKLRRERQLTIVVVTHDVNLAALFAERVVILKQGKVVADGPVAEVLTRKRLESVYETPLTLVRHPLSGTPVVLPGRSPNGKEVGA